MTNEQLVKEALHAAENAYVPHSSFTVGAALLTEGGRVYLGCNIENASFGATCCAERVAFFKAISEGERSFVKIAVVGGKNRSFNEYCPPCGICRQVMSEFCGKDFEVILGKETGEYISLTSEELLPHSFSL